MRGPIKRARLALCLIVSVSILLSAAGEAFAAAEVRLLHAVPGGAGAELGISGADPLPAVGFGKATDYGSAPAGGVTLTLSAGGDELGSSSEQLRDGGRYTVVAIPGEGGGASLRLFTDGEATPGQTRWRMVHAAPELDDTEFVLDDRVVAELGLGEANDYSTVEPGAYDIGARRPGEQRALVERSDVSLVAGTAQTAYLVGSAGERTRFAILQDAATAPSVAPDTGMGGLAGDGGAPWLLALLGAAIAGTLGGLTVARLSRRRG